LNLKTLTVVPIACATVFAAYVAFHPGVAYAEPRFDVPTALAAQNATYSIDALHTGIYFEIDHLELSKVTGRFNKFSGKIREDGKDLTKSSVQFSAEIASIDTGVAERDAHLRTAEYFDAAKFPTLEFKSAKIEKSKNGYVATGDLTIRGKTKRVSIPFRHFGPATLTVGDMSTRIGVVCDPIVIRRSDFGVGGDFKLPDGRLGASDEVTVRIALEGILDK
jgi:polyisoprenoid-binding protein YceI